MDNMWTNMDQLLDGSKQDFIYLYTLLTTANYHWPVWTFTGRMQGDRFKIRDKIVPYWSPEGKFRCYSSSSQIYVQGNMNSDYNKQ